MACSNSETNGRALKAVLHIDTEKSYRGGERQIEFLLRFSDKGKFRHFLAARRGSLLAHKAREYGCEVLDVSPVAGFDPFSAAKIWKFARARNIDIIHSHTSNGASLASLALLFGSHKFIAHRRVDFHISGNLFSRWKYKRAGRVIAVSNAIKQVLIKDGVEPGRISVVHSGVDLPACRAAGSIDLRSKYAIPRGAVIIGMVNALASHKGIGYFLEAVDVILKRGGDIFCFIAGSGELERELKEKSRKLGISGRVVFTGFVQNPLDWINSFDIFVISSIEEGLGSTVIDALALGKPIVATRAGGIPEMIKSGYNGLLAEPANPESLALAVENIIEDNHLRKSLSENAASSASGFDVLDTVAKIEKIYEEILG